MSRRPAEARRRGLGISRSLGRQKSFHKPRQNPNSGKDGLGVHLAPRRRTCSPSVSVRAGRGVSSHQDGLLDTEGVNVSVLPPAFSSPSRVACGRTLFYGSSRRNRDALTPAKKDTKPNNYSDLKKRLLGHRHYPEERRCFPEHADTKRSFNVSPPLGSRRHWSGNCPKPATGRDLSLFGSV